MRFRMCGAVAACLLLATPAAAQPRLEDPEANIVEELVVTAARPGPAWWRVEDEDTTVYILGVFDGRLPAGQSWDRRVLEERMKGAHSLILGTRVSLRAGLRDVPALLRARGRLKSKTPLEETLPAGLRARFVAAREKVGKPAGRYAGWTPLIAGEMLAQDASEARRGQSVDEAVIRLAKKHKVKLRDTARYDAMPFINTALGSLTPAIHQQCLDGALDDIEAPPGRLSAAAQGWARGDVGAAIRAPRSFDKCVLLLGGGADLWRRTTRDRAGAIEKALETPGHAIAIVGLRNLLAEGGVIAQLEARGIEVAGPRQGD
jgi:uncharacterized protein YbaP (TraB family)